MECPACKGRRSAASRQLTTATSAAGVAGCPDRDLDVVDAAGVVEDAGHADRGGAVEEPGPRRAAAGRSPTTNVSSPGSAARSTTQRSGPGQDATRPVWSASSMPAGMSAISGVAVRRGEAAPNSHVKARDTRAAVLTPSPGPR